MIKNKLYNYSTIIFHSLGAQRSHLFLSPFAYINVVFALLTAIYVAFKCTILKVSDLYICIGPIRVQPTALERRRSGVTRGSKRIAAGRPVGEPTVKRMKKKQRNLARNIAQNQANAKSHGTNH